MLGSNELMKSQETWQTVWPHCAIKKSYSEALPQNVQFIFFAGEVPRNTCTTIFNCYQTLQKDVERQDNIHQHFDNKKHKIKTGASRACDKKKFLCINNSTNVKSMSQHVSLGGKIPSLASDWLVWYI